MFIASAIAEDQVDPKELVNEGLDELNTEDLEAYRIDDMLFDKDHYELFLGIESKNKDRTAISDKKGIGLMEPFLLFLIHRYLLIGRAK